MSTPSPEIRCADADRNLVAELLNTAYADGRITHEELEERLDATWRARTFGDLTPLTEDLMPAPGQTLRLPAPAPMAAGAGGVVVDPSGASDQPDNLVGVLSTARREGSWRLRRRTTGFIMLGDAKIDLTQAVFDAHECIVTVPVVMGDIKIKVPQGVHVRDETTCVMGEVTMKGMVPTPPHAPTVVLRGLVLLGEIKVLGPQHQGLGQRLGLTR
ncbi:DUF1707 SHOCT-like domain-containing protein [Luteococcus sp. Sow4_B9]|uniref:DUF1707 SHOCT-like domain-containing protein n=1 Tax=Luteococcus sp. Sow4_B9 TaxID=3438792 RepID=UPI003F965601